MENARRVGSDDNKGQNEALWCVRCIALRCAAWNGVVPQSAAAAATTTVVNNDNNNNNHKERLCHEQDRLTVWPLLYRTTTHDLSPTDGLLALDRIIIHSCTGSTILYGEALTFVGGAAVVLVLVRRSY